MKTETTKITFTQKELELLEACLGNGYGDGDFFQKGFIDVKKDQKIFLNGWSKIVKGLRRIDKNRYKLLSKYLGDQIRTIKP